MPRPRCAPSVCTAFRMLTSLRRTSTRHGTEFGETLVDPLSKRVYEEIVFKYVCTSQTDRIRAVLLASDYTISPTSEAIVAGRLTRILVKVRRHPGSAFSFQALRTKLLLTVGSGWNRWGKLRSVSSHSWLATTGTFAGPSVT